MTFFVQHHPENRSTVLETFDTEAQAETRAHNLVVGHRVARVVVFEADIEEDQT